jgi:hypothetical protein
MKYLLMFVDTDTEWSTVPHEEGHAMFEKIGQWWGEHSAAGRIEGGAQLQPISTATTVRFDGDQAIVTDGPFIEAKERIGGFALVDVADLDEALEMARTWPARGVVEVRPLVTEGMAG